MNENSPFLKLEQPCDRAVEWVSDRAIRAGLTIMRTFDLQAARHPQAACPCPHHGTEQCDCQMVVLLVYQDHKKPITLIAHGYGAQTWFSVVDIPGQRPDPRLEATIRQLLAPPLPASLAIDYPAAG